MEWKLNNCYGEANCMETTSYQLKLGSNWTRHMACRGGCYMIWSLHTLYFALLCTPLRYSNHQFNQHLVYKVFNCDWNKKNLHSSFNIQSNINIFVDLQSLLPDILFIAKSNSPKNFLMGEAANVSI